MGESEHNLRRPVIIDMKAISDKRQHILCAGLNVMRAHGYNGTGVKDIVDAAGVPKGSFYNYFASKEAFAIEALQQVAEGNLSQMRQLLGVGSKSALQCLTGFFQTNIDHLKRTEQFQSGCFIGNICQEMSGVNEAIRRAAGDLIAQYEQIFADCLNKALVQGELSAEIDADAMAVFLFSAWEGALMRMKTTRTAKPLDDFLLTLQQLLKVPQVA